MLRKLLFRAHWLVGLTLGAVLALSGLTGGLLAFRAELIALAAGAHQRIESSAAAPLSPSQLYGIVHAANPERLLQALTPAPDRFHPAQVEFGPQGASQLLQGGPGSAPPQLRMVDPYTGQLLPERAAGRRLQYFMYWVREIHKGHWLGQGGLSSQLLYGGVGLAAVLLMGMALTGLYLRWPHGRSMRAWRSWVKIHWQLTGRAFLWNLHAVIGTCVLLAYLVSGHTGAIQNSAVGWYGHAVRELLRLSPGIERGAPPPGRPAMPALATAAADNAVQWQAFLNAVPRFQTSAIEPERPPDGSVEFLYTPIMPRSSEAATALIDEHTGAVRHLDDGPPAHRRLAQILIDRNQQLHEGRVLGRVGTALMMCAAFMMPVFYVTGWMMYLKRRRSKRRAASLVAQPSPAG